MADFEEINRRIQAVAAKSTIRAVGDNNFTAEGLRDFCEDILRLIVGVTARLSQTFKPYYETVGCEINDNQATSITIDSDGEWPDIYPSLDHIMPKSDIKISFFLSDPKLQEWRGLSIRVDVFFHQQQYDVRFEDGPANEIQYLKPYRQALTPDEIRNLRDSIAEKFARMIEGFL